MNCLMKPTLVSFCQLLSGQRLDFPARARSIDARARARSLGKRGYKARRSGPLASSSAVSSEARNQEELGGYWRDELPAGSKVHERAVDSIPRAFQWRGVIYTTSRSRNRRSAMLRYLPSNDATKHHNFLNKPASEANNGATFRGRAYIYTYTADVVANIEKNVILACRWEAYSLMRCRDCHRSRGNGPRINDRMLVGTEVPPMANNRSNAPKIARY